MVESLKSACSKLSFELVSIFKLYHHLVCGHYFDTEWNVTPLIWRGSHFLSLQHFIAPAMDLMPCLQAQGTRDCNKGIKFKKGSFNCCNDRKISSPLQMCGVHSLVDPRIISPYFKPVDKDSILWTYIGVVQGTIYKFVFWAGIQTGDSTFYWQVSLPLNQHIQIYYNSISFESTLE